MLDVVQLEVVLIVVVGAFVGVEILLQFRFHGTILRLCRQHIRVLTGVGGYVDAGCPALNQHGAGGNSAEDEDDYCRDAAHDKEALFVTGDELTGFLCVLCGFSRRLCRGFGGFDRIPGAFSGFGGGVLPLDGLLLLPAGVGIAGKLRVVVLRRFVQRTEVGAVCLGLGAVCAAVGLLLVGAVGVLGKSHGALRRLLHAVGALHAHIVLLMLPNLTVYGGQGRRSGRVTHRMGQLGGRALLVHLLKGKARRHPAGLRVYRALLPLYGFLGYLRLGLFQLLHALVRFSDSLFQFRRCQLLVGKQQPGRAFAHGDSPPFGAYGTPRKSSTLPQPNLWIQNSYCLGCVSAMR